VRRLVHTVFVLLAVSVVIFLLLRLTPGDPARMLLGDAADPQLVEAVRRDLGLDKPLPVQYVIFLGGLLRGDLGNSIAQKTPTLPLVMSRAPATLQLALAAFLIGTLVAVPVGIISAYWRESMLDYVASFVALVGQSMPVYWSGAMLVLIFSVNLQMLPSSGRGTPLHLVLPAVTLGAYVMALTMRLVRSGMLDTLGEDYVRTARAKGVSERQVLFAHAFRNMAIPVVTVMGLQLGGLLGGAVVTETVFAWPGLGSLATEAITTRDYPLVQAIVLVISAIFVFLNLGVDLLYAFLDPRIRYE
jgi:ABC-type dipeptide/oligopeptide/nickel transport system permease component